VRDAAIAAAKFAGFGKKFEEWKAAGQAKEKEDKAIAKDQAKFDKIADKIAKGQPLSGDEKRWFKDAHEMKQAQEDLLRDARRAQAELDVENRKRAILEENRAKLDDDQLKEWRILNKLLTNLLAAPPGG